VTATIHLDGADISARHITVTGVVQGVGFRPFVYNLAIEMGLAGWVSNHSGGVDIEIQGAPTQLNAFIDDLRTTAPPLSRIESLEAYPIPPAGHTTFEIRHSESQAGRYQLISPDVATCPDCQRELFDPADRRYRYPFINCTNCGPRFTIIDDIPYDRPNTTMRVFPMCTGCRAEYEDPHNRRFHAQPNACPVCGPTIWLVESGQRLALDGQTSAASTEPRAANGEQTVGSGQQRNSHTGIQHPASGFGLSASEDAFARAKALLLSGRILAIKGLGGFHLACDALNPEAVKLLRARKRRPHKPFAVMVAGLEQVRALCSVPPEAEALLTSPQCPIVLLEKRADSPVAEDVAPNSHTLGIMIPYTPLHHILLRDIGRPLIMTSGNLTEEPIAMDNDEALRRLAPLADAFLLHNRDIHARYDDSVVQLVAVNGERSAATHQQSTISEKQAARSKEQDTSSARGLASDAQPRATGTHPPAFGAQLHAYEPQMLRRARGYAPFPVRLPFNVPQIFAAGPLLKNTFTLTRDEYAFVSQHIGDLENAETLEHYQAALATFQQLFRLQPKAVACDLHPDYLSTRLAETFAREHGLPAPHRIQHHHAHIAACLADNHYDADAGPVIGVALDGTGYGEDGHIWGGEWFMGDYRGFARAAQIEYLPLPGGDVAIREPWRIAVAYLHALGMDERLPLGVFCPADVMRVRAMVDRGLNTPLTSSMGRLFDAVSALLGVCSTATYEAQPAIELEQAARPRPGMTGAIPPYPFVIDHANQLARVRVEPLFDALLSDMELGIEIETIAYRFHATVAAMITDVSQRLRDRTGINTLALGGGVFQNRLLLNLVLQQLSASRFRVLLNQQVPPNDGAVSLGQAVMAAVQLESGTSPDTTIL